MPSSAMLLLRSDLYLGGLCQAGFASGRRGEGRGSVVRELRRAWRGTRTRGLEPDRIKKQRGQKQKANGSLNPQDSSPNRPRLLNDSECRE
ncbi:hypothetical protein GQ53DRAFT_99547 [Thozetella sp. PMI_491]|nr:hypothetical protein GQ53DRAFT_99547 [Thozetella sp. PMI_491]